jgi:hypothetical protein
MPEGLVFGPSASRLAPMLHPGSLHPISFRNLGAASLAAGRYTRSILKGIRKGTTRRFKTYERKAPVPRVGYRSFS